MSGHTVLFEIESNLSCCPLNILDLQPGGTSQATGTSLDKMTSLLFWENLPFSYLIELLPSLNLFKNELFS